MHDRTLAHATRRREIDAAPVEVGDAGVWWFARPSEWMFPIFDEEIGGPPRVGSRFGYSPNVEHKRTAFREAMQRGPDIDRCAAFLRFAAALLREAHDLKDEAALSIIARADWPGFTRSILSVAFGPPEGEHVRQA